MIQNAANGRVNYKRGRNSKSHTVAMQMSEHHIAFDWFESIDLCYTYLANKQIKGRISTGAYNKWKVNNVWHKRRYAPKKNQKRKSFGPWAFRHSEREEQRPARERWRGTRTEAQEVADFVFGRHAVVETNANARPCEPRLYPEGTSGRRCRKRSSNLHAEKGAHSVQTIPGR